MIRKTFVAATMSVVLSAVMLPSTRADEPSDPFGAELQTPPVAPGSEPVWHLYVVRTSRRDELAEFLRGRGISTGVHYPDPPHLTAAYAHLGYPAGSFPVAEALAKEALSLPIFPGMEEAQITAVVEAVAAFFRLG